MAPDLSREDAAVERAMRKVQQRTGALAAATAIEFCGLYLLSEEVCSRLDLVAQLRAQADAFEQYLDAGNVRDNARAQHKEVDDDHFG